MTECIKAWKRLKPLDSLDLVLWKKRLVVCRELRKQWGLGEHFVCTTSRKVPVGLSKLSLRTCQVDGIRLCFTVPPFAHVLDTLHWCQFEFSSLLVMCLAQAPLRYFMVGTGVRFRPAGRFRTVQAIQFRCPNWFGSRFIMTSVKQPKS